MRFRHTAGFGKRIEFWIIGEMLKEGLDVYVPLVDDKAIDAVVRRRDGSFVEVQIKARSREIIPGTRLSSQRFGTTNHGTTTGSCSTRSG
jgi:hypothetical protein